MSDFFGSLSRAVTAATEFKAAEDNVTATLRRAAFDSITPALAERVIRAYFRRYLGHGDFPVKAAHVEAMALALNDALAMPVDEDAWDAAGIELRP